MRLLSMLIVAVMFSGVAVFAQEEIEVFLIQKEIKHLPVISQGRTGTCWSFATTSFIESEIIRMGLPETDLSEMFFVNYGYKNRAQNYLMYHGTNNFGQGGLSHDVMNILREKGMVTNEAFPGKMIDGKFQHGDLEKEIKEEITEANKKRKDFDYEEVMEEVSEELEDEIGSIPENVKSENGNIKPMDFRNNLGINPDDYIELTSYAHHPYYKTFVLEIPDNWAHGIYYNLPIDELMEVMYHAINSGYSVCWDGDVSEKLFQHKNGKADLPEEQIGKVDQNLRQETFLNRKTTDDHLMHLVGLSKDSKGRTCFFTKNSWGAESNSYGGYLHMTEDYVKLKTVGMMIHKDALPENIKMKLDL
ncbi:MAG: aminopeptidase [Draconibacterium sp.]|nr:aminopeptidase [Draconibacterium sp.]